MVNKSILWILSKQANNNRREKDRRKFACGYFYCAHSFWNITLGTILHIHLGRRWEIKVGRAADFIFDLCKLEGKAWKSIFPPVTVRLFSYSGEMGTEGGLISPSVAEYLSGSEFIHVCTSAAEPLERRVVMVVSAAELCSPPHLHSLYLEGKAPYFTGTW